MNQVKTYIDKSNIEGIGLFAAEFITKGTLIWKFSGLDLKLTPLERIGLKLNDIETHYFKRYEFGKDGVFIFCSDDAKYCNHADFPNTNGYLEQYAIKDIQIGEEITCNYGWINDDFNKEEFRTLTSFKNT